MTRFLPGFLAALATTMAMAPAQAAGFADLAAIDRAVGAFIRTGPGGVAQPADRRLRLAACNAPLALSWRGDRHETVLVQCPDPAGWRLFVAVRGLVSPAVGTVPAIAAVARGEEVTVEITGDGFTVSQSGEALEAGVVGDWIRVSPTKEGKAPSEPIRAQVMRPGLVAVLLP